VKWLVYLMLLANAGYFAVSYREMLNAPPPEPRAVARMDPANRMLLLSEVDIEELRARAVALARVAPVIAGPPQARNPLAQTTGKRCYSIGPLVDDSQIAAVRTWVMAMGGDPRLRVGERRELARYWVYFPPMASREEAKARVQQMRTLGIDDLIVIPRGDMENAISLGVFSKRTTLERRLRELRTHGYEPSIVPRYRTQKASWFDVSFDSGDEVGEEMVSKRFPGVELNESRCATGEIAELGAESYNAGDAARRYHYSGRPEVGESQLPNAP
jgi:hypothetical protein